MPPLEESELGSARPDVTSALETLASRAAASNSANRRQLTGPERAAVLMLALGEQHGAKIWNMLDDEELRQLSIVMSNMGTIEAELVENLLLEFVSRMSASGALMGNFDHTERLLQQYLPPERVNNIMEEIRGPAGRNMWDKLSNVNEEVLANYLKNEYPQTVAVVLSKIRPEHAARVLAHPARGSRRSKSSSACCAWRRCRKKCWSGSSRRCAPNSCRTWRRRAGATPTR